MSAMPISSLRDRLRQAAVLLCDGAMGTQLFAAGLEPGHSAELWNVERPQTIEAIHRRYVEAGCELITTNTFQGSPTALALHGLADRTEDLNRAAVQLARQAVGADGYVLGDVGPFGGFLEPFGDTSATQLTDIFTRQLAALRDAGADAALIETMSDTNEATIAIRAAKRLGNWPVLASFAFQHAGERFVTMMGSTVQDALNSALDAGADVVGANCGTRLTLEDYQALLEQMVEIAGPTPVLLQPNAGSPVQHDARTEFPATPADMAEATPRWIDAGVRVLGGCCGTTPQHLAGMCHAIRGR